MPPDADRRLAAILCADVVDYSRLMADDEDATVRTLRAWREQVSTLISEHRGRLADFTGDNFLAEFPAARDAVECACEIQRVIAARNDVLPEARRMRFRIGLHLGDVRHEDGRLFGDGVNVAARLQALAEPGGVCLSATLVAAARTKIPLEDLGEQRLKNIPDPVRAYRTRVETGRTEGSSGARALRASQRWLSALLLAAALAVVAIAVLRERSDPPRAEAARAASAPRTAPVTLAVLPFANLTDDPSQEYFSEGISEDILDGLGRNPSLLVRAWQSSSQFRGPGADMQRIADKLGVAYLVNGSVRRQGQRVRVTARLTDVAANTDLWSRRYDEQLTDVFAVQDQITEGIVTALGEHFSGNERRRVPIPAYDAYLLARFYINRLRLDLAEERLHEATALDPSYADAYASWAQVYAQQSWNSPPDLEELIARELELVGKALASDPSNPLAQALEALRLSSQPAIETLDALLRRYPSDTDLLFCYSAVLHRVGRFDLEKAVLDRMVALDPLSLNRLLSRGNSLVNWGALADAAQDVRSLEELGLPSPLLSAQIAMLEDDLAAARSQLARPDADWATFPLFWRDLHRAMLAKLQGDAQGVATALAPLEAAGEPLPSYVQFWIAALKGDDELALDQLEEALERGEPYALYDLRVSALRSRLLPELVASARFAGIQRRFGLDDESVAKLSIPPLPF